jgi:hypothetical protein
MRRRLHTLTCRTPLQQLDISGIFWGWTIPKDFHDLGMVGKQQSNGYSRLGLCEVLYRGERYDSVIQ